MRKVHRAAVVLAVLAAGMVLGSGVSGYATFPGNDPCPLFEDATTDQRYALVPFGTRCEIAFDDGRTEVETFGPSRPAWIAWIVGLTAFGAWAVRRPASRAVGGALAAAAVIGVCGLASHNGTDVVATFWAAALVGTPAAFLSRHLWRPAEDRSVVRSLLVTAALVPAAFAVATVGAFAGGAAGHVGGVLGLLAGAGVSAWPARLRGRSSE